MTIKKFTKEFLNNFCNVHNIILLREYSENELRGEKFIDFICIQIKLG